MTVAREAHNFLRRKILDELLVDIKKKCKLLKIRCLVLMNRLSELFRSYKFVTFIGLTIAVLRFPLVSIAMFMYYKTDAYRLI